MPRTGMLRVIQVPGTTTPVSTTGPGITTRSGITRSHAITTLPGTMATSCCGATATT